MIRQVPPLDYVEMAPQAIFARSIRYFTLMIKEAVDDLDLFEYAAFSLDNQTHFCLRHYRGHPKWTATLYLEFSIRDLPTISKMVDCIYREYGLPNFAVQWRRGDPINQEVTRPASDRLREPEARILFLKIASTCKDRTASTTFVKKQVPKWINLSRTDLETSPSRPPEKRWQQVVGNVVSHQHKTTSVFSKGYADRVGDGLRVTASGLSYLSNLGFSV